MPCKPPRVLIVNDDGPPSSLYQDLCKLGWDVRVVLPSSQKSWSGTNYTVHDAQLRYWYYYPMRDNFTGSHPDTLQSWSNTRRPIDESRGEIAEWLLVDGTPSTCTNIGLFTSDELFATTEEPPFTLVISGPNYGRNTGTAFSVSSGTLGGALAGALSDARGIAISYGHFQRSPPTLDGRRDAPPLTAEQNRDLCREASQLTVSILKQLWENWDQDASVQVYSMNVPLCECLLRPTICWTRVWESRHVQQYVLPSKPHTDDSQRVKPLGISPVATDHAEHGAYLDFRPNLARAMQPTDLNRNEDTDIQALSNGHIGISRLSACFAQVDSNGIPPPQVS
ncbi:hypothetical protein MPSI1_000767 [Malassezia psittaci]|uniref:Survival protein SurE-like phosphatase/nucleotidase domain-containing protein n=1 Tax=Malassezia psittaci TaxID=1821823 RepID=A0AAF0FBX6_9BASI|nr:hypothetical protein MPSI1_000767 [Malassezia psittaci]